MDWHIYIYKSICSTHPNTFSIRCLPVRLLVFGRTGLISVLNRNRKQNTLKLSIGE